VGLCVFRARDRKTQIRRGGARTHPYGGLRLSRQPPIGVEIVFYSERLEDLHKALESGDYAPGTIRLQPWGELDFRVQDPDGYRVRISEGRAALKAK